MHEKTLWDTDALWGLSTPTRNNYFYGKLLDEFHLKLEQNYFNRKRWLLNRLTLGHGVVCGLRVEPTADGTGILIRPGMAIDRWGREIIVPKPSRTIDPFTLTKTDPCGQPVESPPPTPTPTPPPERCVHICLAYHECESEMVPVRVGECGLEQRCAPSTIEERYKILVKDGQAPRQPPLVCPEALDGVFDSNAFDYRKLVDWVLAGCRPATGDPCVVLAEITLGVDPCGLKPKAINMYVRPVVLSNLLLRDLILCLARQAGIVVEPDP